MKKEIFDNEVSIKDRVIKFRKWKVKDRKKFIALLKEDDINYHGLTDSLVYDCLENKQEILTPDEYRYILTAIRIKSVSDNIKFDFKCENKECEKDYSVDLKLSEVLSPLYEKGDEIISSDTKIKLGFIPNKKYYDDKIKGCTPDEIYLVDFLLHINTIDGNDTLGFDELLDYIEELDTNVLDDIFVQWDNIRFKIDDINEVTCPHCDSTEKYQFDDMPNFFPSSWFK